MSPSQLEVAGKGHDGKHDSSPWGGVKAAWRGGKVEASVFIKSHSGVWRGAVPRDSLLWKRFPECISRGGLGGNAPGRAEQGNGHTGLAVGRLGRRVEMAAQEGFEGLADAPPSEATVLVVPCPT